MFPFEIEPTGIESPAFKSNLFIPRPKRARQRFKEAETCGK